MKERTRLNPAKRNELGALLLQGLTPTKAAETAGVTYNHAVRLRKKLVNAGTITNLRNRKSKTKRPVATKTMLDLMSEERQSIPDKVKGTMQNTLNFRINGVEFSVDNAKRIVVENGLVDIKY